MSPKNESVKPAAFSLADPQLATADPAAPSAGSGPDSTASSPNWVIPAMATLVVLALIVVFWLPGRFNGEAEIESAAEQGPAASSTAPPSSGNIGNKAADRPPEATPWSDAQLAKLRKEAQNVLAILLDVQFELQELGVEQWALQPFEAAKALAQEGDIQYRNRDFVAAKASYDQALSDMEVLVESAPAVLQEKLELARLAIEEGDQRAAQDALAIATVIEPENTQLAALKHRTEVLEELLPLLSQAEAAESSGDLASAENLLREASGLDPTHLRVKAELARVVAAHTQQRFNRAMSKGYSALDAGKFPDAREAFRLAAKLLPGSAEASSALQDLEAAEISWKLARLQTSGKKMEDAEQWQQAVDTYNKALAIDNNLLFAQEGLQRSRSRAQLDKQFRAAIDKPERLSDKKVAGATAQLLRQAAAIKPRGPVLEKQLSALEVLLKQAGAQIKLILRSDGETEVTLRKVSRLGQFSEKILTVRPGTYTVIGSRNGYRDVRRTFTIKHDSARFEVEIVCTEQI